jgi:6-phosphofructokinase 1
MSSNEATTGTMAILVGGGPAPGINAVMAAATIRARLSGALVLGVQDGFKNLMEEGPARGRVVRSLEIQDVSRIHFRGGSALGTSRANPTRCPEDLDTVVRTLQRHGVDKLITIGGDDTAFSASCVADRAGGSIRVVHVPKTIDNDLDLPPSIDSFGYQTARSVGVQIVQNLMMDAKTTSRWYIVVAMGRKAGHLALGIGKAAGATLTIIPEEFGEGTVSLDRMADIVAASVIKRRAEGRPDGIVVVAEGLALKIDPEELGKLANVERDAHDHVRLAEIDFGELLKQGVRKRLDSFGIDATVVSKNLGYELRSADPVPYDMEYCRDMGYCAAKYLLEGGSGVLVSMQAGRFVPIPFPDLIASETGRMKVRMVDLGSTRYAIARRYMIRLRRDDLEDQPRLEKLAAACDLAPEEFRESFGYLVDEEPPPLVLR